ncbi:MAG: thpR [Devosia sp.]|nr:thpR [Devosia sp.]
MPRLFTALEVPAAIGLLLSLKRGGLPGARWISPEYYHLTLSFIGDVDQPLANEVMRELDPLAESLSFPVRLTGLAAFGGDRPRSLFAAAEPTPELLQLQAVQDRLLRRAGVEPEARKFVPHVTLARLRGIGPIEIARHLTEAGRFDPLTFTPTRIVLFSSRDSIGGGPYRVEADYPLGT